MSIDQDLTNPALRGAAVAAARGLRPFDILIGNALLLDMVTGQERLADIGLVGPLIASVHAPDPTMQAHQRLEADGKYAMPGFIDTHMHVESSMVTPQVYADFALTRGITTLVWDPHEIANVAGRSGVDYALDAARDSAMRILTLAPTCVPSAPGYEYSGDDFTPGVIASLLAKDDIHGAAEMMTMQPLLHGDARVKAIVDAGLASGKRVCGHARGLSGQDLNAYAAAGVETDHELSSADDLIARLQAGMTVELRGSHEHLLPEFAKALLELGALPQTVTLCTDDIFPDDLVTRGALDRLMRILIAQGMPPAWVYRAATLNAATRIKRPDLGLVAPGKRADIVLMSDLEDVRADSTFINGQLVVASGIRCNNEEITPQTPPSPALLQSVKTETLSPNDFEIPATGKTATIATLAKPRFTEWGEREVAVENGNLLLPDDMIRMAVINRHGRQTPARVAFLEKWGTWRGVFATTVSHDSHNLTLFGRDPQDMAIAANHLRSMDGGLAVVANGEILASLPLPIAGLISQSPLETVAKDLAAIRAAMNDLVDWEPPYLVFKALFGASLVCNPGPRLSDAGIVDVFQERVLQSPVLRSH